MRPVKPTQMFATDRIAYLLAFHTAKNRTQRTVAQKEMRFTMSHTLFYQSCKWAGFVGSDWGLSLPKCFGTISGLHTKPFNNIQSNVFFSKVRSICCAHQGYFCE